MKYIIGSLILSSGIMLIIVVMIAALQLKTPPENLMQYLGITWLVLAVIMYPLAKKVVR